MFIVIYVNASSWESYHINYVCQGSLYFSAIAIFLVWNLKDFLHRGISSKINFTVLKLQNEKNAIHKWIHNGRVISNYCILYEIFDEFCRFIITKHRKYIFFLFLKFIKMDANF